MILLILVFISNFMRPKILCCKIRPARRISFFHALHATCKSTVTTYRVQERKATGAWDPTIFVVGGSSWPMRDQQGAALPNRDQQGAALPNADHGWMFILVRDAKLFAIAPLPIHELIPSLTLAFLRPAFQRRCTSNLIRMCSFLGTVADLHVGSCLQSGYHCVPLRVCDCNSSIHRNFAKPANHLFPILIWVHVQQNVPELASPFGHIYEYDVVSANPSLPRQFCFTTSNSSIKVHEYNGPYGLHLYPFQSVVPLLRLGDSCVCCRCCCRCTVTFSCWLSGHHIQHVPFDSAHHDSYHVWGGCFDETLLQISIHFHIDRKSVV